MCGIRDTGMNKTNYSFAWHTRISDIRKDEWDSLAQPLETPFLEWGWLRALEDSGSISARRGWQPTHLSVRKNGRLVAAAPLYVKSHSEGEFVFDYAWADVANRLGIRYYPKLIGMSPATPVTAYRFLHEPGEPEIELDGIIVSEIERFAKRNNLSGCSFNFTDPSWQNGIADLGYTRWKHHSYIWENPGFSTFEDYLAVFTKNQRRNIRRERQSLQEQDLRIEAFEGDEIPDDFFPLMYRYYENTNRQFGPWAAKYLNRRFFDELASGYRKRLLIFAAFDDSRPNSSGSPIALSFLLRKNGSIYGRFWGSERFYDNLYFNICYYEPIDWAIRKGVKYFDPEWVRASRSAGASGQLSVTACTAFFSRLCSRS